MKGIGNINPDRWREDQPPTRPTELFLDFDPVAPEAPQEKSGVFACGDEHQTSSGDAMAVITIDDFQRLKAAGDLHL